MANRKITELTALTTPAADDVIPIVDISETSNATKNKKITVGNLIENFGDIDLKLANGTEAAPSLAFTSATSTGLYRSAANELSITTNGGQAIKVEANNKTTIYGDLVVTGGTTTISSTTIDVADKNIQLATGNSSDTGADGGGLTLKGASDKTWNWIDSTDAWTSSENIDLASGKVLKVAGTQILSATNFTGTAAIATTVTVSNEASDGLTYPLFTGVATGNLAPKSNANLTYNSANGTLNATTFSGTFVGSGSNLTALNASQLSSGTIPAARIGNDSIVNAKINSSAAIAGTKISPDFGSQNIVTTGTINSNDITIQDSQPRLYFNDNSGSPHSPDYLLQVDSGLFRIYDSTNNANRLLINTDGHIDIDGNVDFGAGVDVTGNITVTGTVDGRDIATDGTKLDTVETNAKDDQTAAEIKTLLNSNGIVNAQVDASAAIAGTKISPDFGSQTIVTTGSASVSGDLDIAADIRHIGDTNTKISFGTDTINLRTGGASRLQCTDSGVDVTGNITVTGTVDGVDIAALNTTVGTKLPLAGGTLTGDVSFSNGSKLTIPTSSTTDYVLRLTDSGVASYDWTFPDTSTIQLATNTSSTKTLNVTNAGSGSFGITAEGTITAALFSGSGASLTSLPAAQLSGAIANGVTATTQSANDNSTKVATTAYTDTAISNLVDSSPSALNTLNELAAALGDDANFSTTVTNSIATKLPLAGGTLTGDTTLANTKKVIFNASSGAGAFIKHQSGHFEIISSVGNTYFASAGTLYLRTNGSTNALTLDSSQNATFSGALTVNSEINARRLTLSDDGAASPTFMLKTDDQSPWGFTIKNDTYSNSTSVGLRAYQANDGTFNLRLEGNSEYNTFNILQNNGSSERQILVFNTSGNASFSGSVTATGGFSGSGASLTNVNATTLDGIDSAHFLRSNAADSMSAKLTLNQDNDNEKLVLAGTGSPLIRFQEGTTNKAFIQWHEGGYIRLQNDEDDSILKIQDDIVFSMDDGSNYHKVWHAGNDGSGSGLDADTLDGVQGSSYLRSDADDTFSGVLTIDSSTNRKLYLAGSASPAIYLQEGTTNKVQIQWDATNGFFYLWNEETNKGFQLGSNPNWYDGSGYRVLWNAGNDGSGSGLDADTLDGQQGSYYQNASNLNAGTVATARLGSGTASSSVFLRGDGTWAGVSAGDATLLDGLDSSQFLRSDTADTMSAVLTLTSSSSYPLDINGGSDAKIVLQGSNNPYIRWREGSTDKAYIQWHSNGMLLLWNSEESRGIKISGIPTFYDGTDYRLIWHNSNDGSGSGLDADTCDGQHLGTGANVTFAEIVATNWLRTNAAGEGLYNQATDAHFYSAGDQYWHINGNSGDITNGALIFYDQYNSTHGGSTGRKGYVYWDANGFGLLNSAGSWAIKTTSSVTNLRGTLTHGSGDNTIWHAGNDGSGSGLDADTLDGVQGSLFVRNDAGNTVAGAPWELNNSGTSSWAFRLYNPTGTNNFTYFNHATHGLHLRNDSATNSTYLLEVVQSGASTFMVRGGDGLVTSGGNIMWHAGNDGAGSGLDADTVDGFATSTSGGANKIPVIASNGYLYIDDWIRVGNNDGLYCTDGQHLFTGGNSSWKSWINRSDESTSCGIGMQNSAGSIIGYTYANATMVGLLNGAGSWVFRVTNGNNSNGLQTGAGYLLWHQQNDGAGSGLDADTCDGQHLGTGSGPTFLNVYCSSWLRNDGAGEGLYNSATGQHWYSDNAAYMNLDGDGNSTAIRFRDGHAGTIRGYFYANSSNQIGLLDNGGSWRLYINGTSNVVCVNHFIPSSNNTYDLGTTNNRWRNVYTNDLSMSNEGGANSVDGTWGDWTIQEGESDLFLLNNRNKKRYKFNLTEVS